MTNPVEGGGRAKALAADALAPSFGHSPATHREGSPLGVCGSGLGVSVVSGVQSRATRPATTMRPVT